MTGNIVILRYGVAHMLRDGSGQEPKPTCNHGGLGEWVSDHDGGDVHLDLCGRFVIEPPHDRLIHNYLPKNLVVRAADALVDGDNGYASIHLANLMGLMRMEINQAETPC